MTDQLFSIFVGVAASLISIMLIAVILRVRPNWAPVFVFALGIALSEVMSVSIGVLWLDQFYFWPATAAVGIIGIVNFFVFSAVYKSVSLQMLGILKEQVGNYVDKTILVEVVARPSVEERMELLVEMGLVVKSTDQMYLPTEKGLITVDRLRKLQRLFGIGGSGLYRQT